MAPNLGLISSPRYAASFLGAFALPLIPRQKADAQRRKFLGGDPGDPEGFMAHVP